MSIIYNDTKKDLPIDQLHKLFVAEGIGSELVRRCLEHYPDSGWLVCTEGKTPYFYKKLGFADMKVTDTVLTIRNKWQRGK